jgi:hypothetical protein
VEVGLKEATAEREEEMRETRGERLVYRTRWHEGAMAQVRIRWCKLCRALGGAEVVGATGPRSCSTRHQAALDINALCAFKKQNDTFMCFDVDVSG